MKKTKLILLTTLLTFFISSAYAAQRDCSVFKHKFDKTICEKQNAEDAASGTTSSSSASSAVVDGSKNKIKGFFKKIPFKKHKKYREKGD